MAIVDINLNPTRRELKWFAGLLIPFSAVVAWMVSDGFVNSVRGYLVVGIGTTLGVAGLLSPAFIRYVYIAWMVAVTPIAFVVSNLIVAVVYYLVVIPIGLMMRFSGRDALALQNQHESSYWVPKEPIKDSRRYFRQY